MSNQAELVYEIDSTRARTAATDLTKMNDAAVRAAGGADKLNRTLRDSQGRFKSSYDVARQYGSEVRSLADKYNPALSAVYKYQSAQTELNRAVALGVLTQGQADAALSRVSAELQRSAVAATSYANGMGRVNNVQASVGNQFAQLNDVVVTAWGGMNPALIGMQQGMQMVQGFAGQSMPQALGTLRGAFMQLLNPLTLVTVGAIAGGAALIQWGASAFSAGGNALTAADAISALQSSVTDLNTITKIYTEDGMQSAIEKYGLLNAEIMRMIDLQRELQIAETMNSVRDTAGAIASEIDSFFGGVAVNLDKMFNEVGTNFGFSIEQSLNRIKTAATFDEQLAEITKIRQAIDASRQSTGQFTVEQQKLLMEIVKSEDALRQLANAANAANNVSMQGLVSQIQTVADAARSAAEYVRLLSDVGQSSGPDAVRSRLQGGGAFTPVVRGAGLATPRATRGGGGGSGGGASRELEAAEKSFQSLRELMERESMFQVAEYQKRQSQLDQALSQKLISEQNYQAMREQLQMMYFGTEFERNAVQYSMDLEQLNSAFEAKLLSEQQYLMRRSQLQHEYYSNAIGVDQNSSAQMLSQMASSFGQMNQLAGGGFDELMRLQKTFAAGSAMINAYLAASQAIADPKVPAWMKIAMGLKVLAAGVGFANAIGGGGGRGGGGSVASSSVPTARAEPVRNTLIRLEGPDFMVDMADSIIRQLYEQSRDGRVIIQRDS